MCVSQSVPKEVVDFKKNGVDSLENLLQSVAKSSKIIEKMYHVPI